MADIPKEMLDFLHQHPLWLQKHAAEFGLRPAESKILSFQQGKMAQLKKKTEHMTMQLMQILTDAQANRELTTKMLALDHRLLAVNTVTQWSKAVSTSLTEDFHLPNHVVQLVVQPAKNVRVPQALMADEKVCQMALNLTQVQCGTVPAAAFLSLFAATSGLASFLQLPLRFNHTTIAFVLIGHEDEGYFNTDLATEWISIMADNMAVSLARLLKLA